MAQPETVRQINLQDYWNILVNRRWVAISFFVISVVSVTLGTFLMTPLYRAFTTVIIEGENSNILKADESSSAGASFDIFENYLQTQMTMIKAKSIAGKVFDEFKLADTKRYKKHEGLGKIFNRKFTDDIELVRLPSTRMVTISIYNPDPKLAADLANRLAEVYAQDNLQRRALTFIRNQRMASMNSQYLQLQSKLDSLSNQFGPMHPEMVALREEIKQMAARIENVQHSAQNLSSGTAASTEDQALLEDTLMKIQENSVVSSSRMNNILIVDRASVPKEIEKPRRLVNIAMGIIMGFLGGIFLAFFVDYIDDSIKNYEDLRKYLGDDINFLGSVFNEKNAKDKTTKNIDRLVAEMSESPSAEAYRLIRTALWWFLKNKNIKDFAVLGAGPAEGKTTVVSNLAIALAQLQIKVLLVDADIRRGRLHDSYGLSNNKGLANYLTDSHMPIEQVIQKTDVPGLSVVTCGTSMINSSQLFSSPAMTGFIQKTRERFDLVLYDTAPLVIISDTAILISQLGGTVLTVRSGVTAARMIPKAISMIKESHTVFIGVILKSADTGDNPYYNRYYQSSK